MSDEDKPKNAPPGATFTLSSSVPVGIHSFSLKRHSHAHGGAFHAHGVDLGAGFVSNAAVSKRGEPLERGAGRGKILFLDCVSGIAGDMTLSALLDLGVPEEELLRVPGELGLDEAEIVVERGFVGALGAVHTDVRVRGNPGERSYLDIVRLIERSSLEAEVKELALAVFERLGKAEANVHGTTLAAVHFHEVGAVDALVDIVGAAKLFSYLGAEILGSPVPIGRGFVECRHGVLPLPAPATLLCLEGVPTKDAGLDVELVTPTGAAILSSLAKGYVNWPSFSPERVGIGAGTRGLPDRPNVLRAVLGRSEGSSLGTRELVLCEANIDDLGSEAIAFAMARLLEEGALDAWVAPVTMKKGRPGFVISMLCEPSERPQLVRTMMNETSTIGVRQTPVFRDELVRRIETIESPYGPIRVKVSGEPPLRAKPEFEDCARVARETGIPLGRIVAELEQIARALFLARR